MMFQCWASVEDADPTLKHHLEYTSRLLVQQPRLTMVTANIASKQLLLFAFARWIKTNSSNCLYFKLAVTTICRYITEKRQTAVTVFFSSANLLLRVFALWYTPVPSPYYDVGIR